MFDSAIHIGSGGGLEGGMQAAGSCDRIGEVVIRRGRARLTIEDPGQVWESNQAGPDQAKSGGEVVAAAQARRGAGVGQVNGGIPGGTAERVPYCGRCLLFCVEGGGRQQQ